MTLAPERPAAQRPDGRPAPWRGHGADAGAGSAPPAVAPDTAPQPTPDAAPAPQPGAAGEDRPVLADGVDLTGEYEGSGYREPHYLARRGATIIQLTRLLYLIAEAADGTRSPAEIAERVSGHYGKTVTADNVRQLVHERLRPLGVLANPDGSVAQRGGADLMLGLKFRVTLLSEAAARRVTRLFRPLFWPPVIAVALAGLAAFDVWLFLIHGLAQGLRSTVEQPVIFLLVAAVIVVSAGFHEFGHAAACSYGGGRPGRMGAGVYVAWPAFYTDVTDAYRLDRRGRLRTDLGGVYFNTLVVLAVVAVFAATRYEPLLLICFLVQMQILQQLLPVLRLDGYYVLSDAVGVPDLFKRMGPILRSLLPWRRPEPEVTELKPRVRAAVSAWTAAIVPLLLLNLLFIVLQLPRIVATSWDSAAKQWGILTSASGAAMAMAAIQLIFLAIPALGSAITMSRVGKRVAQGAWRWSSSRPARRAGVLVGGAATVALLALAWWPDARVTPYRAGEPGTVQQGVQDLRHAGQGSPLLRSPEEAQRPLPAVRAGTSAVDAPAATEKSGSEPATTGTNPAGTAPNSTAPDGTAPDGTTTGGTAPDGTAPDGTAPGGTAPDGTTTGGTAPDGTTTGGTAPDGTADGGSSTPGPGTGTDTTQDTTTGGTAPDATPAPEAPAGGIVSPAPAPTAAAPEG